MEKDLTPEEFEKVYDKMADPEKFISSMTEREFENWIDQAEFDCLVNLRAILLEIEKFERVPFIDRLLDNIEPEF